MEQISTAVPAQESSSRPQPAAGIAADVMRTPLTTVGQHDHAAAAAYLMKHAGTHSSHGRRMRRPVSRPASSRRQTLPAPSRTGKTSTTSGSMP